MNERVKVLAEQATIKTSHRYQTWGDRIATETKEVFDKEKFAELIVQECIDIIAPYSVRMSRPGEEYLHPIQEIKQHFGVEE
jgi:hypothetical protein